MREARNINTFNKKRFIKGLTISLLIVLSIESFRLTRISDHNGGKFLAINMSRLGDMDGNKTGPAIVLQPHTIKTEHGDIRLKMFCSIDQFRGKFSTTENQRYKHNLTFFGQPITGDKGIFVSTSGELPLLGISMYQYKREKFQYYGQDIIPVTIGYNYTIKVQRLDDERIYTEDGNEIQTRDYKYEYHKGMYFYTTYTREDTSPITLNDGSVIYSEATYVIHAPEDEDWTIELDGDVNYERYIQFPNGKKIDCEKVIIEPYWGRAKEVTTLEGDVFTYSE